MPRTGNSFLRKILELITGVYTGADMTIKVTLQMVFGGRLAGEETVSHDNLCWVTKTHWPMESPGGSTRFSTQKAISIVRNPIDMIPSLALLATTASHTFTCTEHFHEADPIWWAKFVEYCAKGTNEMLKINQKLMHPAIPTYYIRYEDLVLNPAPVLSKLFCFLLEVSSIEGTVVEKRIADYLA